MSGLACLAGLVVVVLVLPAGTRSQFASQVLSPRGAPADVSPPTLTVDQVRASFVGAGFQADPALSWTWTSPPVTTLRIFDQASGRVLMALVYPDTHTAQTERLQAQAHEPSAPVLDGYGPHLVPGYGESLWRGNVALVQTTQSELDRLYRLQQGGMLDLAAIHEPSPPDYVVDLDFQQALEHSAVNL
ncbi:MAG TPA: hypothetical protein VKV73_07005 [Chloroflexota bacterium]|nr:hypothetical protein [Chloroflexota bacterium]